MGNNTSLYIGPYITVKGKTVEMLDREVLTCSNKKCYAFKLNQEYSKGQKFCVDCGSKIERKEYKEKWVSNAYDLITDEPYEEFCDELYFSDEEDDECVFRPNEKTPFDKKRGQIEEYLSGSINLIDSNSKEEIAWFKKRYKKIIDVFKKELGEESVKFEWGVVQSYN